MIHELTLTLHSLDFCFDYYIGRRRRRCSCTGDTAQLCLLYAMSRLNIPELKKRLQFLDNKLLSLEVKRDMLSVVLLRLLRSE